MWVRSEVQKLVNQPNLLLRAEHLMLARDARVELLLLRNALHHELD